nr:retrovirus-related Pol polyprotein from transposon TNT 1-94 [Tanacetum cinerariifolium]
QNEVAERINKTLIEIAKTMLADSKLPTTLWAEAVNTSCYVQNRILVVKPHFKTPYELIKGRSHALSFMRPFGCHVTILNTLDQLGMLDGKLDEGIFVGYSTTSKAFRVYNIRTRKVKENMHITFLENKPMIECGGPEWLFDLDALSKSTNYAPVSACTNSNDFAGKGASFDAGQSSMKTGSSQDYILMPLWKDNSLFDSFSQASDNHNKDKHGPSQASESDNHERPNTESSTKTVNTDGPVNIVTPTYADYPIDPLMPDLEDAGIFDDAYDDRDEGAIYLEFKNRVMNEFYEEKGIKREYNVARTPQQNEAEAVNTSCYVQNRVLVVKPHFKTPYELIKGGGPKWLFDLDALSKSMIYAPVSAETVILVSLIPSTRIYKDHPKEHIIEEVNSVVQIKKIAKENEAGLISFINMKRITNHKDFQNCLFACFLSQMEPKKTKIHVDNESAICVVKNLVYHSKTKHIEIRHHFIRDSYKKRSWIKERLKLCTELLMDTQVMKGAYDAKFLTTAGLSFYSWIQLFTASTKVSVAVYIEWGAKWTSDENGLILVTDT